MSEIPLVVENLSFQYRRRDELAIANMNFELQAGSGDVDRRRERMRKDHVDALYQWLDSEYIYRRDDGRYPPVW